MQPAVNSARSSFRLRGLQAGRHGKCRISRQPQRSLAFALREAHVRNHKWRAPLQTAMYSRNRPAAFLIRQEVERQKTSASIERTFRRLVNVTLMQIYLSGERAQSLFRQTKHLTGGIDSIESPSRVSLCERPQFQSTSSAQNQYSCLLGRVLFQQQSRHALQIRKARHLARRIFRVPRHGLSIREGPPRIGHPLSIRSGTSVIYRFVRCTLQAALSPSRRAR